MNLLDCSSCLCGVTIGWLPSVSVFPPSWLRSRDVSLHKGQHKKGWQASFGQLHKKHVHPAWWGLWRRGGLMVRKDLFSSHKNSLTPDTISVPRCCLWIRACVCLASAPFTFLFILAFNRLWHILFLLEDANITHDNAPVDSSQTKHFLPKAVLLYSVYPKNYHEGLKSGFSASFQSSADLERQLIALLLLGY